MKILITGGAGFQGSHLVEYLLTQGHIITVLNTWSEEVEKNSLGLRNKVKFIWGDVADKKIVEKAVSGNDLVFHLAGKINIDESIKYPLKHITANYIGTYNVLEAVKKNNNRLIYTSSCEVYGDSHELINERHELKPKSPYSATKAAADRLCYAFYKTYGVKVVIMRPFNVFGERQKEGAGGAVIPIFVVKALKREPLTIFGTGEQKRDYMHISDLINAYGLILKHLEISGEVINFGTGKATSIKSIAEYIAKKLKVTVNHGASRPGEVEGIICDYTKAKKLLDWEPKVTVWQGIDKYIGWRKKISQEQINFLN